MSTRPASGPRGFVHSAVLCAGMVTVLGACPGCAAPPSPWADAQHDTTRGFQDPLLDRFTGTWVLEGMIAGGDVVHDVTAEWVSGHQYLRFVELSPGAFEQGPRLCRALLLDETGEQREALTVLRIAVDEPTQVGDRGITVAT